MSRSRNWVFTLNNPTEEEKALVEEYLLHQCTYGIVANEVGANGTPHLQGYCENKNGCTMTAMRKRLGGRAHVETRMGNREQARAYCMKDGDFKEFGKLVRIQGQRTDLDMTRALAIDEGMRAVSAVASHQEIKVAENFLVWNEPKRNWKPHVIWMHGATGLGKSRMARWLASHEYGLDEEKDIYTKNDGTKWWPGYDAHKYVIIDDFRPSWWPITEMLSLLDRYEKRVEFKGGYRQLRAEYIIVTSAFAPQDCYEATGESIQQLIRRIDEVKHFVFEWTPPNETETIEEDLSNDLDSQFGDVLMSDTEVSL